jgi:hypothetical protein
MDVYWGCACKTPGCNAFNLAHRIGPFTESDVVFTLPSGLLGVWDFGCMKCGNIHKYIPSDLEARTVSGTISAEWVPWW